MVSIYKRIINLYFNDLTATYSTFPPVKEKKGYRSLKSLNRGPGGSGGGWGTPPGGGISNDIPGAGGSFY